MLLHPVFFVTHEVESTPIMKKRNAKKKTIKGLTRSEVKRITGLSDPTIRKYRNLGILRVIPETDRPGVHCLYVESSIPQYMRRTKTRGKA